MKPYSKFQTPLIIPAIVLRHCLLCEFFLQLRLECPVLPFFGFLYDPVKRTLMFVEVNIVVHGDCYVFLLSLLKPTLNALVCSSIKVSIVVHGSWTSIGFSC